MAPGHKKISQKARHDYDGEVRHPSVFSHFHQGELLPLFSSTGLLLDSFFPCIFGQHVFRKLQAS